MRFAAAAVKRVSLIPHRNDWTDRQKATVAAVECALANRGLWREGDVMEMPWTNGFMAHWLRLTGWHNTGLDEGRECLREAQTLGLLEDTGRVIHPRNSNDERVLNNRGYPIWWRIFVVVPLRSLVQARWRKGGLAAFPVCLRGWARSQGLIFKRPRPSPGSVQESFHVHGPP